MPIPVSEGVDQLLRGPLAKLGDGDMDRRQRGIYMPGDGDVIEPGDSNFFRNSHPGFAKRAQCADRHGIVGGEDRGGAGAELEKRLCRFEAGVFGEVAGCLPLCISVQRRIAQRGAITELSLVSVDVASGAGDDRDTPVAVRDEMADDGARARGNCRC